MNRLSCSCVALALSFMVSAVALWSWAPGVQATEEAGTRDVDKRATVVALREALQRVAAAHGLDRRAALAEIDRLLAQAERDPASAGLRLGEAYALVRGEIRGLSAVDGRSNAGESVRVPPVFGAATEQSFRRQRESAGALRDALARIAEEPANQAAKPKVETVDALLAAADRAAAAGDLDEAKARATEALDFARAAIRVVREGTTQVRALVFASAAEEYRYEIDRHDSYRMLFRMSVPPEAQAGRVAELIAESDAARRDAEAMAAAGDHAGAIIRLEAATRACIAAMRSGGVFLPG
jgi:hypothetical protein